MQRKLLQCAFLLANVCHLWECILWDHVRVFTRNGLEEFSIAILFYHCGKKRKLYKCPTISDRLSKLCYAQRAINLVAIKTKLYWMETYVIAVSVGQNWLRFGNFIWFNLILEGYFGYANKFTTYCWVKNAECNGISGTISFLCWQIPWMYL